MSLKSSLAVAGLLIGVLGIGLSIYFYHAQKRFKGLAFVVDPKRVLLVSPGRLPSSNLTLLDQDGTRVTRDVYSAEIYIWNNGTETILASDVIVPLAIEVPPSDRLLDLQTTYVSRKEITLATLAVDKKSSPNTIHVSFRVLEPGEGIRASVLYEGGKDAELVFKGAITGIRQITDSKGIAYQERWSAPWKKYLNTLAVPLFFGGIFGLVFGIGAIWKNLSKRWFPRKAQVVGNAIAMVFWVPVVMIMLVALVGGIVYAIIDPWLHPEKVIQENITDYMPKELKRN